MSNNNQEDHNNINKQDEHENDTVMPGFRFHPTEEELVEFYLRRKVEGKRFNVELIAFLELYRYDPWELPALAAIGEKEWYFYVPRDRKYRNGDRPNRVTTSGYWKATGADRMIRSGSVGTIGLKRTLVFYSGKAPKGTRSSWIMNEYRLPHHETRCLHKAEISLCRVYKRAGVEDQPSLPRSLLTKPSSSSSRSARNETITSTSYAMDACQAKVSKTSSPCSSNDFGTSLSLSHQNSTNCSMDNKHLVHTKLNSNKLSKQACDNNNTSDHNLSPNCPSIFSDSSSAAIDGFHKPVSNYSQQAVRVSHENHHHHYNVPNLLSQSSDFPAADVIPGTLQVAVSDRVWDWNAVSEANKDFTNLFK